MVKMLYLAVVNSIVVCFYSFLILNISLLFPQLYVNSRFAKPHFRKYGFEVLDTGNMYLIRTHAGLKIQWFHSTGMMVIEKETHNNNKLSSMGLCGKQPKIKNTG